MTTRAATFSIILCSRNRAHRVDACLKAISELSYPSDRWELVFVDNASMDDTSDTFRRCAKKYMMSAEYVFEATPGLSRARNAGLAVARNEIIVFTDDDCYVDPGWLRHYAEAYTEPDVGFVGGQVRPYTKSTAWLSMLTREDTVRFDPGEAFPVGAIHGANMSCRRMAAIQIGGFDVRFGAGAALISADDTDFLARLLRAGWKGIYWPAPIVYHDHEHNDPESVEKVERGYSIGEGGYFAKMIMTKGLTGERSRYAKRLYRKVRDDIRYGNWRELGREVNGALRYLVLSFSSCR